VLPLSCDAPPPRSAGGGCSGPTWREFLAGSGARNPGNSRCAALFLARRAARVELFGSEAPDRAHRQAGAASFLLRYRGPCGGIIQLSYAMEGGAGERQRAAMDEAIAAALSGGELSSEFIGGLTQDAVRYLADSHGNNGEEVKTYAAPH
jgi:hypothetical protein